VFDPDDRGAAFEELDARIEAFALDDLDAALARFAELGGDSDLV
jgi:hypothetical protein